MSKAAMYPIGVPVPGWCLTLGLALGGVRWAIESVSDPEFRQRVADELQDHAQLEAVLDQVDFVAEGKVYG